MDYLLISIEATRIMNNYKRPYIIVTVGYRIDRLARGVTGLTEGCKELTQWFQMFL